MIKVNARNARPLIDILSPRHWHFPVRRNSRAIAKFRNAEINYFVPKMVVHDLVIGSPGTKLQVWLTRILHKGGSQS